MAAESIRDDVLGEIVEAKGGRVWTANVEIRDNQVIQMRLIGGPSKTLSLARTLVPWMRENDERARHYAADQLLDLHIEACNDGKSLTQADFVDRLFLDSAAIFDRGCNLCYKDKLQEWEHIVNVVYADGKFVRAGTAPTLWRPEGKIQVEPFPPLVLNVVGSIGFWDGKATFQSWHGFSSRLGAYGSLSSAKPSNGTVRLSIKAPGEDKKGSPSHDQASAYRYLLDHEKAVQQAILEGIFAAYPGIRDRYGPYIDAANLPEVVQPTDLMKLVGLSTVHVLATAKDGTAYIGFEFGCTWDSEHGLGVMTHQDRVIDLGGADTSFLEWIAAQDAKHG